MINPDLQILVEILVGPNYGTYILCTNDVLMWVTLAHIYVNMVMSLGLNH